MPPTELPQLMHGTRESTARLLLALGALTSEEARQPALLPGWTNGHVLTHLARNADAMVRGLDGARRGEPTPPYPHGDQGRAADIEAGAGRPAEDLVEDVRSSAQRLDDAWLAMTPQSWDGPVPMRTGPVASWQLVEMRWREVEVHWVDLDLGYGPDSWPAEFTGRLLRELTGPALAGRLPGGVRLLLHTADTAEDWDVGSEESSEVAVYGPSWALACWLAGRAAPVQGLLKTDGAGLPVLAPWR
jgi:maleylpyruvate isomerase